MGVQYELVQNERDIELNCSRMSRKKAMDLTEKVFVGRGSCVILRRMKVNIKISRVECRAGKTEIHSRKRVKWLQMHVVEVKNMCALYESLMILTIERP